MVNGSRYLLPITRLLVYLSTRLLTINLSTFQLILQISNNILIFPVLRFAVFLC